MRASKGRSSFFSVVVFVCLYLLSVTYYAGATRGDKRTAEASNGKSLSGTRKLKTKGEKVKGLKGPTRGDVSSNGQTVRPLLKKNQDKTKQTHGKSKGSKGSKGNAYYENFPYVSNLVPMPNPHSCVSCVSTISQLSAVMNANTLNSQTLDVTVCANAIISWAPSDTFTLNYNSTQFILRCCGDNCVLDGQSLVRTLPLFSFFGFPVTIEIRGITFQNFNYNKPLNVTGEVGAVLDVHATSSVHIEEVTVRNIISNVSRVVGGAVQ